MSKKSSPPQERLSIPPAFQSVLGWEDLVLVDPRSLDDNPHNWKTHPPTQMTAAMAAIKACGWVLPVLYNLTTNRLIDGHGRKAQAIKDKLQVVPVARGRWTEQEELTLLGTIDVVGSMYKADGERLSSLSALIAKGRDSLKGLSRDQGKTLAALISRTSTLAESILSGDHEAVPLGIATSPLRKIDRTPREVLDDLSPQENPETTEQVIVDDVFFNGDSWGLPELDPGLLATREMLPTLTYDRRHESVGPSSYYCQSARPFKERYDEDKLDDNGDPLLLHPGGILGFFTEDFRFSGFYEAAADMIPTLQSEKWSALLAPDFSTYDDYPFPMRLWNLYRSRWVARYWQSFGLRIIPVLQNVNFEGRNLATDSLLSTLGTGIPVVAVQCRTIKHHGGSFREFGEWLTAQIHTLEPRSVLIYGGEEHASKFLGHIPQETRKLKYSLLPSYMECRRRIIAANRKNRDQTRYRNRKGAN